MSGGGAVGAAGEGEPVRVELRGLSAFGAHGVSDAEREVGRRIVLDIAFTVPACSAVASDELEGTVDYGAVAALAEELITERSFRTLEALCGTLAGQLSDRFEVREIEVRAAKPEPPISQAIEEVAVTVRRGG